MTTLVESRRPGILALGFYILSFLSLSHSVWVIYQPSPLSSQFGELFGGRTNFLTLWGLALTWLVFTLKLTFYYVNPSKRAWLRNLHETLNLVALPLESSISFLYWTIMAYDPSLMLPPPPVEPIPRSLDIALHLYPALFLWLDHLFFAPTLKVSRPTLVLSLFAFIYTTWIEVTSAYGNNYQFPYPFLTMANRPVRYMIYISSIFLSRLFYSLATATHRHTRTA